MNSQFLVYIVDGSCPITSAPIRSFRLDDDLYKFFSGDNQDGKILLIVPEDRMNFILLQED